MPKRTNRTERGGRNGSANQGFQPKSVIPLTDAQKDTFEAYSENLNLFLYGSAGSGKSFLALYLMLKELLDPKSTYTNLIIIRSAVAIRDQGYLPGSLKEKSAVYEIPYKNLVNEIFSRGDAYDILTTKGTIVFETTSFLRGITFNNSLVFIDEASALGYHELSSVITRMGKNCRFIFAGDTKQNDLIKNKNDVSGMPQFLKVLSVMDSVELIEFTIEDVVRSGVVREFLLAEHKVETEG